LQEAERLKTDKGGDKASVRAPSHLAPETARWVEAVLSEYVLEPHHQRLLLLAAESWDRGQEARGALARHGLTFTDRLGNVRARPEAAIVRDSAVVFSRLLRELALDVTAPPETSSRPPALRGRAGLRMVGPR
jgi:hypothetical protein